MGSDDGSLMETLSLSDLPMHGNNDAIHCHNNDHNSSSSSCKDEDLFEFDFDFRASTSSPLADDIVFCGKRIPYKKLPVYTETERAEKKKQQRIERRGFLGLKSFNKGKKFRSKSMGDCHDRRGPKLQQLGLGSKSFPVRGESAVAAGDKYDFTVPKVPVLICPHKSQWQVFFRSPRISGEMNLRDMKIRQNRRTMESTVEQSSAEGRLKGGGGKRNGKKLWGILNVLGCGIGHANTVAKASMSLRWVE